MLDANQIYERECTAGMKDISAGSVDLAFADPPFNIGYEYDVYDDSREAEYYLEWSRQWIKGAFDALRPTGTFWLAIGDEYAAELKIIAQEIGFKCRSWVIWYYTFGVNCKRKFNRSHAHLFHFVKDSKRFKFNADDKMIRVPSARQLVYADGRANPDGRLPDDTWILRPQDVSNGFKAADDTWYFPRVAGTFKERAGFHGCQMPEQLLGRIVRCCSDPGDLVLDPFSGSATTLVVAKKLGRRWIGFDLSTDYVCRGRKRVEAATTGDALEGAAEPLASAPPTPAANLNVASISRPRDEQRHPAEQEATPTPSRLTRARNSDDSHRGKTAAAAFERGIVEAFRLSAAGYSVDRVVADDELNADFADRCTRAGLPGGIVDWNRLLFRLRKSGKLSHLVTRRRTEFDWGAVDRYLFASEIALGQMDQRGKSLDEVFCDPELRREFDNIARSFAPGFRSLDYRWAALRIRKAASDTLKRAETINDHELQRPRDLFDIQLETFRDAPGLYLISPQRKVQPRGSALYAGVTFNLEQRLRTIFDGKSLSGGWASYGTTGRLYVTIRRLDRPNRGNLISQFAPHQSRLVGRYRPTLNFDLASA